MRHPGEGQQVVLAHLRRGMPRASTSSSKPSRLGNVASRNGPRVAQLRESASHSGVLIDTATRQVSAGVAASARDRRVGCPQAFPTAPAPAPAPHESIRSEHRETLTTSTALATTRGQVRAGLSDLASGGCASRRPGIGVSEPDARSDVLPALFVTHPFP